MSTNGSPQAPRGTRGQVITRRGLWIRLTVMSVLMIAWWGFRSYRAGHLEFFWPAIGIAVLALITHFLARRVPQ